MKFLRNLDLAIVAGALAVFLGTGLPILGWVTGAGVWLLWRGIGAYTEKRAAQESDPRRIVGITAGSMVGRGWMLGIVLIVAGLVAGDRVGLSAAVLAVILFTVAFSMRMVFRAFDAVPPAGPNATPTTPSAT